ncbi:6-carboxytetrahydropterin synthase [bacterium SCSIO 12741]|nr:6-carboxytetrahydropterin synthase [bacterium SCSIO 12741]
MKATVKRKAHFNAAHRLHYPGWSEEKNEEIFGLCNNPYFHGHNYELEVEVTGEIDPVTGFVVDLKVLSHLIDNEVVNRFDHKNLNQQCEEFANLNPTAENIAVVIWQLLDAKLDKQLDLRVILYETPRNSVSFSHPRS